MKLTAERLRESLNYDRETGVFTHRIAKSGTCAGTIAGWIDHGYIRIGVDEMKCYAHRLAWLYVHGEWPKNKIDHWDGDKLNNAIANLREASDKVNAQNIRAAQSNNASGFLGVHRKRKKFVARIYANGRQIEIGSFDEPERAHAAYLEAKRIHHEGCTI